MAELARCAWRCERGDPLSCNNFGAAMEMGSQVSADDRVALEFYDRACAMKASAGCDNAARLRKGESPPDANAPSLADLIECADAARAPSNPRCQSPAERPLTSPPPPRTGRNRPKCAFNAPEPCPRECDAGDGDACEILARVIFTRVRGPEPASSYALFQRGCRLGQKDACSAYEVRRKDRSDERQKGLRAVCGKPPYGAPVGVMQPDACSDALDDASALCTKGDQDECEFAKRLEDEADEAMCVRGGVADCQAGCDAHVRVACRSLAVLYLRGDRVAQDRDKGTALLESGCSGGDGAACYLLGGLAETTGDLDRAARDYALARRSHARGCEQLLQLDNRAGSNVPPEMVRTAHAELCNDGRVTSCKVVGDVTALDALCAAGHPSACGFARDLRASSSSTAD